MIDDSLPGTLDVDHAGPEMDQAPSTIINPENVERVEHDVDFGSLKLVDTRGHFCDLFLGTHRKVGKVALKRLRNQGGGAEYANTLAQVSLRLGHTCYRTLYLSFDSISKERRTYGWDFAMNVSSDA